MKQILIAIMVGMPIIGMEPKLMPGKAIEDILQKDDIAAFAHNLCKIRKGGSGILSHQSPPFIIKADLLENKVCIHENDFLGNKKLLFELNIELFCKTAAALRQKYLAVQVNNSNAK